MSTAYAVKTKDFEILSLSVAPLIQYSRDVKGLTAFCRLSGVRSSLRSVSKRVLNKPIVLPVLFLTEATASTTSIADT